MITFAHLIKQKPKLRLILIGFGTYREHIEVMLKAMVTGNKSVFKAAAHSKDEKGDCFLESSIDVDKVFVPLSKCIAGFYHVEVSWFLNQRVRSGILFFINAINI